MAARTSAGTASSAGTAAYRRILLLYPRDLREHYGPEMLLAYAELRRRHGRRVWARLLLDLAVSVPRTRLESVMSTAPTTRTVVAVEVTAAVLLSFITVVAFGPWALPVPVLLAGLVLVQRSRLARSTAADPRPSAVRAAVAGLLGSAVVLAGTVGSWLWHLESYSSLSDASVVLHNLVAGAALLGVLVSAALVAVRLHRRGLGPANRAL